jgi:hypothetical protein
MATKNTKVGRKSPLSKELIEKAHELIAAGNYAVVACQLLGICQATYYNYLKKGEKDLEAGVDSLELEFLKAIKEAEAEAEARNVALIQTAAQGTWQAAAWYLERKHKDRWSVKSAVELTGKEGGPIEIESPRERIERRIISIAGRIGETGDTEQPDR